MSDSESNIEKESQMISASTSASDSYPVAFEGTGNFAGEENINEDRSRRASVNSFQRSLEIIRRSMTGQSIHSVRSQFSVKDIFGDLDSEEIAKERLKARNDVLSELKQDIENQQVEFEPFTVPESGLPIENNGEKFGDIDPELITWEGYNDPEDPRNWSPSKKIYLLMFVSLYTLISPMTSSILSPAVSEISKEFGITNPTISSMLVSIQILAWAVGPLLIAPLSEFDYIGRKPILDASIWLSFFFNLGCGLSQNTTQMMIFRFIGGLFGSSPINVGAGVISDLFDAKSRNVALAGFTLAPLLGPIISPVMAGYIVEHTQWRWVFHVLSAFNGAIALVGTFFYKETFAPKLLKLKAKSLRKATSNENLHTIYEITDQTFASRMFLVMTRPIKLLFTHPMIIGLGSFLAFVYGFMYLLIVTFPTVFGKTYGFDKGTVGLMYIPMGIGFILGIFFWTYFIGRTYETLVERNNGVPKPEFRLPCLFVVGFIIPIGLVWYGWSAEKKVHWIMPGIGSAIFSFGFVCAFQCCQSYLIDMNPRFAASSVSAAALFRSLFGFSFPLFANQMYDKLGYGWGNTLSAFIALLLGVPFPLYCYFNGEKIRENFNKRFDKDQIDQDKNILKQLN